MNCDICYEVSFYREFCVFCGISVCKKCQDSYVNNKYFVCSMNCSYKWFIKLDIRYTKYTLHDIERGASYINSLIQQQNYAYTVIMSPQIKKILESHIHIQDILNIVCEY